MVYEVAGEKADLYMPVSFQVNDGFDYATASLGLMGMGAMAAANSGEAIASSVMQTLKEGAASVAGLFKSGAMSRVAAVRASQNLGDTAKNAVSITARASMNPNLRTQFNGVSVREFIQSHKITGNSNVSGMYCTLEWAKGNKGLGYLKEWDTSLEFKKLN